MASAATSSAVEPWRFTFSPSGGADAFPRAGLGLGLAPGFGGGLGRFPECAEPCRNHLGLAGAQAHGTLGHPPVFSGRGATRGSHAACLASSRGIAPLLQRTLTSAPSFAISAMARRSLYALSTSTRSPLSRAAGANSRLHVCWSARKSHSTTPAAAANNAFASPCRRLRAPEYCWHQAPATGAQTAKRVARVPGFATANTSGPPVCHWLRR